MTTDNYSNLWGKIVRGTINPPIQSLPLKIKINFLRMQVNTNNLSEEQATKELRDYCLQNEKMLEKDLKSLNQIKTV